MVRFAHRPRKFSRPHCHRTAMLALSTAYGRPPLRYGPTGDCRCACRCVGGIGTGNIKRPRFARVRSGLRPASNREQDFCLRVKRRILRQGWPHRGAAGFFDQNTVDEMRPSAAVYGLLSAG